MEHRSGRSVDLERLVRPAFGLELLVAVGPPAELVAGTVAAEDGAAAGDREQFEAFMKGEALPEHAKDPASVGKHVMLSKEEPSAEPEV